ncbi:hypothetical protein [Streptomyces sp. NBC_00576]|uniref:hypothetical protein n=1 Tax=Streptomyces sp. NBC_00576 TaxID=2903665 RepID=UPI002E8011E0|nr:hypothetical protein [Streptomyces sp. NBC_00576]WUB76971.1 hypothetical protein OG734_46940 [Streptomyces sp. NBC_00576]
MRWWADETVIADSYKPGARTVQVRDYQRSSRRYEIPVGYVHETSQTQRGSRRITGYYLTALK